MSAAIIIISTDSPNTGQRVWDLGGGYLIVDLKFLDHSQLNEHPQSCCDHGVHVQREIVKGELVDAQFTDEGDVGGLFAVGGDMEVRESLTVSSAQMIRWNTETW